MEVMYGWRVVRLKLNLLYEVCSRAKVQSLQSAQHRTEYYQFRNKCECEIVPIIGLPTHHHSIFLKHEKSINKQLPLNKTHSKFF